MSRTGGCHRIRVLACKDRHPWWAHRVSRAFCLLRRLPSGPPQIETQASKPTHPQMPTVLFHRPVVYWECIRYRRTAAANSNCLSSLLAQVSTDIIRESGPVLTVTEVLLDSIYVGQARCAWKHVGEDPGLHHAQGCRHALAHSRSGKH